MLSIRRCLPRSSIPAGSSAGRNPGSFDRTAAVVTLAVGRTGRSCLCPKLIAVALVPHRVQLRLCLSL